MSKLYLLIALIVVLALPAPAVAQDAPPWGREFWVAFLERLENARPGDPMSVVRLDVGAGDAPADVHVEIPGSGWAADVSVTRNGTGTIIVPTALAIAIGSESVEPRAVHVTSTAPIIVTAVSHVPGSADATVVLPMEALGSDYVVATYDPFILPPDYSGPAELAIVAPESETMVEITLTALSLGGRPAGLPFTVTLGPGELYQVQSLGNLSGTRVRVVDATPCDRIAVFAGNVMAQVDTCNAVDHLYEQMIPVTSLGTEYRIVPLGTRVGGDIVEVIAVEDGTMLANWSGGAPTRLDAGERVRWRIDSAARISATKPVVAMQYERGRMCDGAEAGDPSMVQLRPLASDTSLFVVGARGLTFARYFLTVIMPTADTASLYSLGTVRLGPFRTFPDDPAHAWIRLEAHGGVFPVRGRSIVGAVSHGAGPAVSYAADLTRVPSSVLRELTIRQECTCEGVVLEASEGFASYRWSTGDTTRTIVARASGSYSVVGTSDDCMLASSPVSVDVAPMPSVRFEPRAVTVDAGEIIPMTLVVDRGDQAGACALTLRAVALRFRASMLVPEAVVGGRIVGDSIAGADRIITLEPSRDTVLLDMVAAFGDTTTIAVTLDAIVSDSCARSAGDTLALITFTGCEVGGRRLFLDRDAAAIKPVRIAGGASSIAVAYRTLEEGPTRLELVDPLGRRLAVVVDATLAPGEHTAVIDIAELAAGSYTLVLVTPSRQIVERFIITR